MTVLKDSRKEIDQKRLELRKNKSWIVPTQRISIVSEFKIKKPRNTIDQPLNSPDLAPGDFFIPGIKIATPWNHGLIYKLSTSRSLIKFPSKLSNNHNISLDYQQQFTN